VLPSQFWAIAAETKHPEASAMLVNWLLNEPEPAKTILANRGLQFNPDILAVVKPLLAPADAQAAEYLEKVLEVGVVAPPQPAGGGILNELSQRIESDILFGKSSIADGSKQWVDELTAALAAG
jgi:multiple sugar transport system substrate-binding protein